jgi:AP-2 complex subunit beta-1
MAYINVDKVTDCLCEPLRTCLKDKDPYVRKTAAICVPKVYFNDRQLVLNEGLLDSLRALLADSNPTVGLEKFYIITLFGASNIKDLFIYLGCC